jgi:hypothetical protein
MTMKKSATYAFIVAFLIQLIISTIGISKNPTTPFDESTHFDYVVKLSKGHIPQVNEKYGDVVLAWEACKAERSAAWAGIEPCGSDVYTKTNAPFYGQSPATGYPPHYYLVTAIPYEICDRTNSFEEIQCARFSNSLWLDLAAGLSAVLIILFGAPIWVAVIGAVGFSTLPAVLLQGITVNSDAAAQALAPALILIAAALARKRWSLVKSCAVWSFALFMIIPIKQTILPMVAISTLLLWQWKTKDEVKSERTKAFFYLSSSAVVAILATFVLQSIQVQLRGLGGPDHMSELLLQPWDQAAALLNIASTLTIQPFGQIVWAPFGDGRYVTISVLVSTLAWIAFFSERNSIAESIERGILRISSLTTTMIFVVAAVSPVVLAYIIWIVYETAPVTSRYYMATAAVLGCIGLGQTSSKSLRNLMVCVLLASTLLTLNILLFR